jgi:hypothetical protein
MQGGTPAAQVTSARVRMPAKHGNQQQQERENAGRDASGRVYTSNSKDASKTWKPTTAGVGACREGRQRQCVHQQ